MGCRIGRRSRETTARFGGNTLTTTSVSFAASRARHVRSGSRRWWVAVDMSFPERSYPGTSRVSLRVNSPST